ncbi:hypothetical protein SH1V18_25670 [Vallitalea longa]|uniref:Bypass of forespore C C-terminal domain-containing protein n=1 Tax=Vallitalea longa TaxID=2936439 RepID=A0A9W5YAV2_9FIRM|nr:hypothetical protein [Vallitalea longa]GKX30087.1 hypothetical protein SH1V18_25670 [Vallitalea longa]
MKNKKILIIASIVCVVAISVIAVNEFYGYVFNDNINENDNELLLDKNIDQTDLDNIENNSENLLQNNSQNLIEEENYIENYKENITDIEPIAGNVNNDIVSVDTVKEPKIMSSTRIEYQNYYTVDGKLEIEKEVEPPYYMINLTREQIEEFYPEYQLISFSAEKVILRTIIEDRSDKYYIIKRYNTNIGVFHDYRGEENNVNINDYLRDTIDIEVNNLVWEEQEKLNNGIIVYGEEELSEILKKLWHLNKLNQSKKYILKEYNGVMGIFYDYKQDERYSSNMESDSLNKLLEEYLRKVVETPVSGLEEELMNKLKKGITVNNEEELIRLLENYTS